MKYCTLKIIWFKNNCHSEIVSNTGLQRSVEVERVKKYFLFNTPIIFVLVTTLTNYFYTITLSIIIIVDKQNQCLNTALCLKK